MERLEDRVTFSAEAHIATITLDRPERLNAFDPAMYEGLNQALTRAQNDDDVWVIVVQANGERAFSAGADVHALNDYAARGITTGLGRLVLDDSMVTDKPILAAVHGHCVGEGINLVLGCDLVFADEGAQFAISEVRIGVNPVDIPLKLAKRLGYAPAFEFLALGEPKSAQWAASIGFVAQVCNPGTVQSVARAYAERLVREAAPLALRAQKATLWKANFESEAEAKRYGDAQRLAIRQTDDYAEGRKAFLEKRTPRFTGR